MTTMEERMSRMEGIIEGAIPQISQRLSNLEQGQADLRREMSSQSTEMRREMSSQSTEMRREMSSQSTEMRREMSVQFTEIHRELRSQFKWLIGTLLGTGVALLASIITGFISLSNS